ncbi:ABC transporter ATP-binding protein [Brucella sp. TWI559]
MGIKIESLDVTYGEENVISQLSLNIPEGCFFTLLGPSGCGKTTLLRTIAGFVGASNGSIRFGDKDVTHLPPYKRNIGMVFQDYALFPDKTVQQNVAYGLTARGEKGESAKAKIGQALERVGLSHLAQRHPAALSGGQRQRVALARALVIKPAVLLMDEPLSNLDAKLRIQIRETICELQREDNITTVFVTHDQEEALAMSDQIGVMNRGALEQIGTPKQIYTTPRTSYVADFVGSANCIPVKVQSTQTNYASVCIGTQIISATDNRIEKSEQGGILIIRPENLHISAISSEGKQTLPGKVYSRQYLGTKTSYRLDMHDGLQLFAELHGQNHDAFGPGDEVHVTINPDQALVIAS